MKRLRGVFHLTVMEQRVLIVIITVLVLSVAWRTYSAARSDGAPLSTQPSPSPGMRP